MINWPTEHHLSDGARHGLACFRQTAAAQELADDRRTWKLEATSWFDELPVRLIWRDRQNDELCFTLEEDGRWWLAHRWAMP